MSNFSIQLGAISNDRYNLTMPILLILLSVIFSSYTFAASEQVDRAMFRREYQQEKKEERKKKKKAKKLEYQQRPAGKYKPEKKKDKR